MVGIIWDISGAVLLNVPGPFKRTKPTLFTIYCQADMQPFIDVLDCGHYASMNHRWLFNAQVQCNPNKLARYLAQPKFKYRRVSKG